MPIKDSAKKYMRVTARRTQRNKVIKGVMRSAMKKTRDAIAAGNPTVAKEWFTKAQKALDKAAQKKVIKKNTASRRKSRLAKLLKTAQK